MPVRSNPVVALGRETFAALITDRAMTMAAALAYYTFFSIAPVVIIAVAVAGLVVGHEPAQGVVRTNLTDLVGPQAAEAVEALVKGASGPQSGVLATLLGAAALIFGATGVFAELQDALNVIWKAPRRKMNGVLAFLRTRALSFAIIVGIGVLLMVASLVSLALSKAYEWVGRSINSGLMFVVTAALFALVFKVLPDVKVAWRDVWFGAAVTASLFTLGKYALGLVLGQAFVLSTYGAAASLAAFLLWVYYSSMILLLGAELSHAIAARAKVADPLSLQA
jgi:membrane protein